MKTSDNHTALVERYLAGGLSPTESREFESALSDNRSLRTEFFLHKKIHRLYRLLGRYTAKKTIRKSSRAFFESPTGQDLLKSIRS